MKVLVIDVAGTHLKTLASRSHEERRIDSGPTMTPSQMVKAVKRLTADWSYDVIAMGYPGMVILADVVIHPSAVPGSVPEPASRAGAVNVELYHPQSAATLNAGEEC